MIFQLTSLSSRVLKASSWAFGGFFLAQIIRLGGNLILTRMLVGYYKHKQGLLDWWGEIRPPVLLIGALLGWMFTQVNILYFAGVH